MEEGSGDPLIAGMWGGLEGPGDRVRMARSTREGTWGAQDNGESRIVATSPAQLLGPSSTAALP